MNSDITGIIILPLILLISILAILVVVAIWKIFVKAGRPGWAALIPIYSTYVLLKIVGRPGWWIILSFVPMANIVISAVVALDLAKVFGKSTLYGVLALFVFPFVGYLDLGFGSSKYIGFSQASGTPPSTPQSPPQPANVPPQASPPTPPQSPPTGTAV